MQFGKNEKSFLVSFDEKSDVIIKSSINYSETLTKNRSSSIALAANSFGNMPLAELVSSNGDTVNNKANLREKKSSLVVFNDISLMANNGYQEIADTGDKVINYTVEDGDSPASIAESFGVTTNTLLWANNLKNGDLIKPGNVLRVPPISGVEHKVVDKDTVDLIAKKYNAKKEDIIVYNTLPASGEIKAGEYLIVPNGVMPEPPKPVVKPKPVAVKNNNDENVWVNPVVKGGSPNKSHKFPWGQCTYWVAQKRYIPWGGDAKRWLNNAPAFGFKTGKTPAVGAVVVTTENPRYGHVAYVEAVTETTITISEMNYKGLGIISQRVLPIKSKVIRGYIY